MLLTDMDALACDMAETYHVFDASQLPVKTYEVLASGLRADSRIRMKMSGLNDDTPRSFILATMADRLTMIHHMLGTDPKKERELPELFTTEMKAPPKEKNVGYSSPDDFKAAWERLRNG